MTLHCNAGVSTTNMVGDSPGYGTVWYHKSGTANILSFAIFMKIVLRLLTLKKGTKWRSRIGMDRGRA